MREKAGGGVTPVCLLKLNNENRKWSVSFSHTKLASENLLVTFPKLNRAAEEIREGIDVAFLELHRAV